VGTDGYSLRSVGRDFEVFLMRCLLGLLGDGTRTARLKPVTVRGLTE
jgi:hypothetical protein